MEKLLRAVFVLTLLATPFSTSRESALGGVVSFALPLLALFAVLYFAILLLRGRLVLTIYSRRLVVVGSTYVLLVNFMALFSPDSVASLSRSFVHLLGLSLLLFAAGADVRDEARQVARSQLVRRTLVTSGVLIAIYFLLNVALQVSRFGSSVVLHERYVGGLMELPWGATNIIASALLLPTFLAGLEWERGNRSVRLLMGIAIAIMVTAIGLTSSRTVGGVMIAGFILYNILHKGIGGMFRGIAVPSLAIALIVILGFYFFGNDLMGDIFRVRADNSNIHRFGGRNEVWATMYNHIYNNPFMPIGYYASLYVIGVSGHNLIITTYVEIGVMGVVTVLGIFILVIRLLINVRRYSKFYKSSIIMISMWIALFINMQFEDVIYAFPVSVYLWTCLGISMAIERSFSMEQ